MAKRKKGREKIEISKKTLVIIIVIAVIIVIGLLSFYLYNSGKLGEIFKKTAVKTGIKSEIEVAEKLTDVAGDISSLKEDLGSLTKVISGP